MNTAQLTEKHSLLNDTIFRVKTIVLAGNRFCRNLLVPVKKFKNKGQLINEPVIAVSESALWNNSDNKANWILTAGKIENLRIAARKLNGIEVKANEVFSFWRHIGNPNFRKGFVIGREIREGCIVPTIAGGLCQLSNALYDAALKANFEIVERHRHTKVIQGSLAEKDRDATVKWNYIDLRFKSDSNFRIEVELSAEKLIVIFKSKQQNIKPEENNVSFLQSDKLNDCYSCGNFACSKHPDRSSIKPEIAKTTTFILDEKWPEFDEYIKNSVTKNDFFIVPIKESRFIKTDRYSWSAMKPGKVRSTTFQGVYRAIKLRYAPKNNNIFEVSLQLDKKIAQATVRKIPMETTHLVISQNLLPFIFETGALGGRTFDVLMTRLPVEKLHERLDFAHSKHPESTTLNDFRASQNFITLENKALTKARKIITPHAEIAGIFNKKVEKLSWKILKETSVEINGSKVLFPASAVGRKGAYEIKKLAKELNIHLVIAGTAIENENFWEGMKIEKFNGNFDQIGLVIYPAYVEHQPRLVLKAIFKGIPVITTTACGLENCEQVKVIDLNNFEEFRNEVCKQVNKMNIS